MKHNSGSLFETILLSLTEQLLLFPITYTMLVLVQQKAIPIVYVLLGLFCCLILFIHQYILKKFLILVIAGIFLIQVMCLVLINGIAFSTLASVLIGFAFMVRASWLIRSIKRGFSFYTVVAFGVISYIISAFLYSHNDTFESLTGYLGIAATLAVIGSCLCINITHLSYERRVINKVSIIPQLTKNSNIMFILLFIFLVLFIASLGFLNYVWDFILTILNILKDLGTSISNWYEGLFEGAPPEEIIQPNQPQEDAVISEPSATLDLVDVLYYAGYYLGLAFLSLNISIILFLIFRRIKKVFPIIKDLIVKLYNQFMTGHGTLEIMKCDYEDEITSLLNEGESAFDATRKWLASKAENDRPYILLQDNTERARWLYKRCVRKSIERGLPLNVSMTSNEVLCKIHKTNESLPSELLETASNAYNMARYGTKEPDNREINDFRRFYLSKRPRV